MSTNKKSTNSNQDRAWEKAYTEIKNQILSLQMKPGEMVVELSIAKMLGISRTPVREAIKMLEQEGLIESVNRRSYVYILSTAELSELFDLKRAIESSMVKYAAERRTPQQIKEMKEILHKVEAFAKNDLTELTQDHQLVHDWLQLDERFHAMIFEMARNHKAEAVVANLNHQWHRLQLGILAMEGRLQQNIQEHLEMGTAIIDGDEERAATLMDDHLHRLQKTIVNIMQIFHFPE